MKITRLAVGITFVGLLFSACSLSSLQNSIDMKVSMNSKKIEVNKAPFKQKAAIQWEITNRSSISLDPQKYAYFLGDGRIGDRSSSLFTELSIGTINPGETKKGTYEKTFEGVVGATGDYELRFWMDEKTEDRLYLVKQTAFPFRWETP